MLFTVISPTGTLIARHLTARDAMAEICLHDSHDYEIRRDADGFLLWVTQFSGASTLGGRPMVRSRIWSLEADEAKATEEIARKVIAARWSGYPEAIPDASYEEMERELNSSD